MFQLKINIAKTPRPCVIVYICLQVVQLSSRREFHIAARMLRERYKLNKDFETVVCVHKPPCPYLTPAPPDTGDKTDCRANRRSKYSTVLHKTLVPRH